MDGAVGVMVGVWVYHSGQFPLDRSRLHQGKCPSSGTVIGVGHRYSARWFLLIGHRLDRSNRDGSAKAEIFPGRCGGRRKGRRLAVGGVRTGISTDCHFICLFRLFRLCSSIANAMEPTKTEKLNSSDRELLQKVQEVINGTEPPILLGPEGGHVQMPAPLFHVLTQATRALLSGQSVSIYSEGEELTTQAAADLLGCSRPYLVKLLDQGEIPFHYVGTHRRISLRDMKAYQRKRDQARREALAKITQMPGEEDYAQGYASED